MIEKLRAYFDGSDVAAAFLFGSHARGRPHRESDVDIAVLLESADPTERFDSRLRLIGALADVLQISADRVDVVVLNDAPPLVGREVIRTGLVLISHNPERLREFERDVQLYAADIEPFMRRMRAIQLETLTR